MFMFRHCYCAGVLNICLDALDDVGLLSIF